MAGLLRLLGIHANAPVVLWAAELDLVVSAFVLVGAAVGLIPVTAHLLLALAHRRWDRARRFGIYWVVLFLLSVYCLASVIDGLDTVDLIPS